MPTLMMRHRDGTHRVAEVIEVVNERLSPTRRWMRKRLVRIRFFMETHEVPPSGVVKAIPSWTAKPEDVEALLATKEPK